MVDIDESKVAELAKAYGSAIYSDWRTVVRDSDIDAIVVCTPNDTHAEISIEALKAGKHVLCEKPIARNVDEATRILEASRKSMAKIKCGFNHRYHPAIMRAKGIVDSGEIGKLIFIRCRYGTTGRKGYENDWRMNPEISGGGQLIDQGQHTLDLFRWFGGEISEVMGYTDTLFWNVPVEDNAFALLRAKAGHICSMHMNWTEWKNLFSFEIFGKTGYLKIEGLGGSYGIEKLIQGKMDLDAPFSEKVTEFKEQDISFREEWREFTSAIKENRESISNAEDGLAALKITAAIYESSKEGRSVKIT